MPSAVVANDVQLDKLGDMLFNQAVPMKERYRALFTLKNLGGKDAIRNISKGFQDPSVLLKHECAYCLGQLQDESAIDTLIDVLSNQSEDAMVRHEAGNYALAKKDSRKNCKNKFLTNNKGEALGAIGINTERVNSVLTEFAKDPRAEVAETCVLALNRLEWLEKKKKATVAEDISENPYYSVDPAPPHTQRAIPFLREQLLNEDESMFERYRAMFQLRNDGSDAAILALCEGLRCQSALFRHEIAYVLGQVQSPLTVEALRVNLEDPAENHMVRHECAEALGAIATDECTRILSRYLNDAEAVVKESCEVALDITDYEKSNDFQYANTLAQV
jgi:deoxyhypusine monooxygenase